MIIDDDDDESNDNAQSDFVRVALNLAFLTEAEARSFKFNKDEMTKLRRAGEKLAARPAVGNIALSTSEDVNASARAAGAATANNPYPELL